MNLEFAIIGPTASGKSQMALNFARKLGATILSLDALSVYKQIDIASAKPTLKELEEIRHFGINLVYPNENFSVGNFIDEYKKASKFCKQNSTPLIITGGTGFYLKTMLDGLSPKVKDIKPDIKNSEIFALAKKLDPEFTAKFSQNDSYRLKKWYSIYKQTGEIPTNFLRENRGDPVIKNLKIFEIYTTPETLNPKIRQRTKNMLNLGLIDEAKFLFEKYGFESKALNSIGLKEARSYLKDEISHIELEELISTHTIQLAKRQRTFNRSQFKEKISASYELLEDEISKFID
ncbi:MAG: tRNA (adenosine(37)-N6)-dimethylallyltransferase MiaA [Campylobacter sp.]|nr:tRNA (adenosine(37)-N6)-dimethylallyltransferase MiaA [Campylobacter sp.]